MRTQLAEDLTGRHHAAYVGRLAGLVLIIEHCEKKDSVSRNLDIAGCAAIQVRDGTQLRILDQGFVWIRFLRLGLRVTFFSVYQTPNEMMPTL